MTKRVWMMLSMCFFIMWMFPYKYTNPDVEPYTSLVMNIIDDNCPSKVYFHPNSIKYLKEKLEPGLLGVCKYGSAGYTVTFDSLFWDRADPKDKLIVAMHEMTHCILLLPHSNDPENYMYAYYNPGISMSTTMDQFIANIKYVCN